MVSKRPLMIVDDDETIREMLTSFFEEEGFRVLSAANGLMALAVLQAEQVKPCLILLDLMMPVMDGWQFLEQREHNPQLASIPVLLLSASRTVETAAQRYHTAGCLAKPFNLPQLLERIQRCC